MTCLMSFTCPATPPRPGITRNFRPTSSKLSLADAMAKAETFAATDYNHALLLGAALPAEQRRATVKQLARLTGLSRGIPRPGQPPRRL